MAVFEKSEFFLFLNSTAKMNCSLICSMNLNEFLVNNKNNFQICTLFLINCNNLIVLKSGIDGDDVRSCHIICYGAW